MSWRLVVVYRYCEHSRQEKTGMQFRYSERANCTITLHSNIMVSIMRHGSDIVGASPWVHGQCFSGSLISGHLDRAKFGKLPFPLIAIKVDSNQTVNVCDYKIPAFEVMFQHVIERPNADQFRAPHLSLRELRTRTWSWCCLSSPTSSLPSLSIVVAITLF